MGIPQEYILSEMNGENGNVMGTRIGTLWEVFSVSNSAKTYTTYEGKIASGKASFLESFFVTNQVGDFLHIYSDPKPNLQNGTLSTSAINRGWINVSSVLLWRHCLVDKKSGNNIMAFTYSHPSLLELDAPDSLQTSGFDAFFDPELKENRHMKTQDRQIYYIYKTTNPSRAVLIGKEKGLLHGSDPKETIIGWIPVDQCYLPETKLWITPNTTPDALDEMKAKNTFPVLLTVMNQANLLKSNPAIEKRYIIWKFNPERYKKKWIAFPVTDRKDEVALVKDIEEDFQTAYTVVKANYMDNAFFKLVTLLSNEQLFGIIMNFRTINELSGENFDRPALIKCLVHLQKKKNPDLEDEQILNLTLNELFENLFWISNSKDPAMAMKLRKINDPASVSEAFISSFLKNVKTSEEELKKIGNCKQPDCSFLSFNTRYFWVDLTFFF